MDPEMRLMTLLGEHFCIFADRSLGVTASEV